MPQSNPINDPLWPGPRLLVPIYLDALLIGVNNQTGDWANVEVAYDKLPFGNPIPGAFAVRGGADPPALGVHLQWTLPEAFRQGVTSPDGETSFPNVPNRWLITRTRIDGDPSGQFATLTVWVLQSDFTGEQGQGSVAFPFGQGNNNFQIQYIGKRFDLNQWTGPAGPETPFLTAMAPADVSFTTVYDNVRNVLSFHDDLSGQTNGRYAYSVTGWYATADTDPLFGKTEERPNGFPDRAAWSALMNQLGWTVGSEAQLNQAIADWQAWLERNPITGGPAIPEIMKTLPGQSLCQGMLYAIEWFGSNHFYPINPILDGSHPPIVAVGNTAPEAISAWMAEAVDNPAAEDLLMAFQMGQIFDFLKDPEDFHAAVQATSFGPSRSVRQWVVSRPQQESGDPPVGGADIPLSPEQTQLLTQLNRVQLQLGAARHVLHSLQQELFAGGWKQAFVSPRDRPLRQQIKEAVDTLVQQIEGQNTLITNISNQLEEDQRNLEAALGEDFTLDHVDQIRLNQPLNPSILVAGASLDTKLKNPNDPSALFTRFTGQTIRAIKVSFPINGSNQSHLIDGSDLREHVPFPANTFIPKEMDDYWVETLFFNTDLAPLIATIFFKKADHQPTPEETRDLIAKIEIQQTLAWNDTPQLTVEILAELADFEGVVPAKRSVSAWTPPWTPLFLDWEVVWHPSGDLPSEQLRAWELDEFDFQWKETSVPPAPPNSNYSLRVLLNAQEAQGLADSLQIFLDTSPNLDQLPIFMLDLLRQIAAQLGKFDMLTQPINGYTQALLQQQIQPSVNYPNQNQQIPELTAGASTFLPLPGEVNNPLPFFPIRAGHFEILNLQVVDAYGQILRAKRAQSKHPNNSGPILPIRSRSVFTKGETNQAFIQIPPRISQSSRLNFRLIDAENDQIPSNSSDLTSAICGWLIPNHLDDALIVFDAGGENLGGVTQVLRDQGTGLRWDPVPGTTDPLGAPPKIDNRHLRDFTNGLLLRGATGSNALRELLDVIDVSLWASWPVGQPLPGNLSALIGTPIAMVRTAVTFELDGLPAVNQAWKLTGKNQTDGFEAVPFSLRLGDIGLHQNGALGYFLDDDYSVFYPLFGYEPAMGGLRRTLANGGGNSRQQLLTRLRTNLLNIQDGRATQESSGYIGPNHSFGLPPDNRSTRFITILVDPSGRMPLISGVQPVQYLALSPGPVTKALENMFVSFRTGPVLLDPQRIHMPLPAEISGDWSWIERVGITVWNEDDQLATNNPGALLPETIPSLREGWLKLSGALGSGEE